jgi:hypothetical protein
MRLSQLVRIVQADRLPGGLGDDRPDSDFDSKQLAKGIEVELEHVGNDRELAKEIAKDHLVEDGKYYDKLETIEEHH